MIFASDKFSKLVLDNRGTVVRKIAVRHDTIPPELIENIRIYIKKR